MPLSSFWAMIFHFFSIPGHSRRLDIKIDIHTSYQGSRDLLPPSSLPLYLLSTSQHFQLILATGPLLYLFSLHAILFPLIFKWLVLSSPNLSSSFMKPSLARGSNWSSSHSLSHQLVLIAYITLTNHWWCSQFCTYFLFPCLLLF